MSDDDMSLKSSEVGEFIRVGLVEDDEWIRNHLSESIDGQEGFQCRWVYGSAESALEGLKKDRVDVVLMDIHLPGITGIEAVKRVKKLQPEVEVLMLTVCDDAERVFESLKAGASGYLLKRTGLEEVLRAIREVKRGGAAMTGSVARRVVDFFKQKGERAEDLSRLTAREQEILGHLADGHSYKEIASMLDLAFDTVRMHVKGIYRKLHVHSRGEAVAKYMR